MKYYRKSKQSSKKVITIILSLIILCFLLLFVVTNKKTGRIFQYSKNFMLNIENKIGSIFYKKDQLVIKDEVLLSRIENLEHEIALLKEELELKTSLGDYDLLNATVINRNIDTWFNSITIDRGKNDAIRVGMAVISSNGLIGKVIEIYDDYSIVELLTSKYLNNISVGVKGLKGYNHGLIADYQDGLIVVKGITNYDYVYENARVVTTGINKQFPAGLLIGYVKKIQEDKYNISKILHVQSNQNFNDIRYVAVIME